MGDASAQPEDGDRTLQADDPMMPTVEAADAHIAITLGEIDHCLELGAPHIRRTDREQIGLPLSRIYEAFLNSTENGSPQRNGGFSRTSTTYPHNVPRKHAQPTG